MRAKTDPALGLRVKEHLASLGLETLNGHSNHDKALIHMRDSVGQFLEHMGLDVKDPSILDTPQRVAEMFVYELCAGLNYDNFPKATTTPNGKEVTIRKGVEDLRRLINLKGDDLRTRLNIPPHTNWEERQNLDGSVDFKYKTGRVDEMVMVDTINTVSLCEHHFQTISGVTHVAYLPGEKLLGLSKFARVVDFFARRPQIQERMTEQVYAALSFILETPNIAVVQVCTHNCMRARGAMDPHSKTTTSKMGGKFRSESSLRQEFLDACPNR